MVLPTPTTLNSTGNDTDKDISLNADKGIEVMEVVEELASLLNTGLEREELSILVNLIELGVNPQALAQGK